MKKTSPEQKTSGGGSRRGGQLMLVAAVISAFGIGEAFARVGVVGGAGAGGWGAGACGVGVCAAGVGVNTPVNRGGPVNRAGRR